MKFADYFYHLAHRVFKLIPRQDTDINAYSESIGPAFDGAMGDIFRAREQVLVLTATGKALDACGQDRGMPRFGGETDDQYRLRLLKAFSFYRQFGTKRHMLRALRDMGYASADIDELYLTDPARWAEFVVQVGDDVHLDCRRIYYIANALKPSHTLLAGITQEKQGALHIITRSYEGMVDYPLCNIERTASIRGVPLPLRLVLLSAPLTARWPYQACGVGYTAGRPGRGYFGGLVLAGIARRHRWSYPLAGRAMPAGEGRLRAGTLRLGCSVKEATIAYGMCGQVLARSDAA